MPPVWVYAHYGRGKRTENRQGEEVTKDIITELAYQGNGTAMDWIEEHLALHWAQLEHEEVRQSLKTVDEKKGGGKRDELQ